MGPSINTQNRDGEAPSNCGINRPWFTFPQAFDTTGWCLAAALPVWTRASEFEASLIGLGSGRTALTKVSEMRSYPFPCLLIVWRRSCPRLGHVLSRWWLTRPDGAAKPFDYKEGRLEW